MAMPASYVRALVYYTQPAEGINCNTLWYTAGGDPSGTPTAAATALANAILAVVGEPLRNCITSECVLSGVTVELHDDNQVYAGFAASGEQGTAEGDTLPSYCAAVIRKYTTTPGKSGRGRWYIGGIGETDVNDSRISGATLTYLETLGVAYKSPVTAAGISLTAAMYSPFLDTLTAITDTVIVPMMGTMRSRKRSLPL